MDSTGDNKTPSAPPEQIRRQIKKLSKAQKLAALGLAVLLLAALGLALRFVLPVRTLTGPLTVEVLSGMGFNEALGLFAKEGLIRDPRLFRYLAVRSGIDRRVRPGRYVFEGSVSPSDVFAALEQGKPLLWPVTVAEGDNTTVICEKLSRDGLVDLAAFDRLVHDKAFMASFGITAPSLEGYLYPETYNFPRGMRAEEVLGTMVRRMMVELTPEVLARARKLGFDANKLLTMASIIEKEAVLDTERPKISAVYHNRLKKRMPLQADPTVVYGIKPLSAGITKTDLRRKTPYNTYVIKGLPPGPIASPGLPSILAALSPTADKYIYFVSNNDGSHIFTSTLRDHNKAVRAYRAGRAKMSKRG